MDRLHRKFAGCAFGLLLVSPGCKMTRPEVPPSRPYANDGRQRKAIEFSTEGHPVNGAATANFQPYNNAGGSNLAAGIGAGAARPDASAFGAPGGAYGPPGTAGLGRPPGLDEPRTDDSSATPAATEPPSGMPPTMPDLNVPPTREASPAPNPVIQPPAGGRGRMGTGDQMPSPY